MLAQQNSKQKSIFFNLKPTVIDKLISKNKCSIQNSLFYSNEETDESLSGESEESSLSSRESSVAPVEVQGSSTMAPVKRNSKVGVLGSKLSAKAQIAIKRKPGRPPGSLGKRGAKQKVTAAKKVLETRKGRPPKVEKEGQETVRKKRATNASPSGENMKRPRNSQRQDTSLSPKKDKTQKSSEELSKNNVGKKKSSDLVPENKSQIKSPRKTLQNSKSEILSAVSNQCSPRKFPSNVSDHWKTTGLVIRGRGRPTGLSSRARGSRIKRGALRGERYITRDSQVTGLMRSGKMRKLSDPNLVEGLASFHKRRSLINRIKVEKIDCPSDEQSSFVTTSELSFGENENSLSKLSDDDTSTLDTSKVKVEDTEDESTIDTNSNLFKNKNRKLTPLGKSTRADVSHGFDHSGSSTTCLDQKKTPMQRGRGRRKLMLGDVTSTSPSSTIVKESESSPGSPSLTNSPKSGFKRQKRKHDGSWVRRSTRSVGKTTDEEESGGEVMQELFKEKREVEDINISAKCSLSSNSEVECSLNAMMSNVHEYENKSDQIAAKVAVIEPPICTSSIASSHPIKSLDTVFEQDISATDLVDVENNKITNLDQDLENNSLVDFTLEFEESPAKSPLARTVDGDKIDSMKFNFDADTPSNESNNLETCDNSLAVVQSNIAVSNALTEVSSSDEILSNVADCSLVPECMNKDSDLEKTTDSRPTAKADFIDDQCDLLLTNSVSLTMESFAPEKSDHKNCNDQEVLSDENILSMIDSFCHSDTSDFTIDEDNQKIAEQIEKETTIVGSKMPLVLEAEAKTSEKSDFSNVATDVTSFDVNPSSSELLLPEENQNDFIDDFKEVDTSEETAKLQDIKLSSAKDEIILFKGIDQKEEKTIEDLDEKMETDFVTESKSADSTDESSSSDSNSHLMQLVPTQLQNELDNQKHIEDKHSIELLSDVPTQSVEEDVNEKVAEFQCTSDTPLANGEQTDETKDNTISDSSSAENNITHEYSIKRVLPDSNVGSSQEMPSKELLSALGLQSLHTAPEEKPKRPTDSYTGTLKAVIKLNRSSDKKAGRKIIFKQGDKLTEDLGGGGDRLEYRICSNEEVSTEGVPLTHLGDIPANRKIHLKVKSQFDLSNSPNIIGTAGSTDTSGDATKEAGKQNLVIPEKSSSFSIHPERLCTDVCTYCFGKFGSLDTPCHLATLKNSTRLAKILEVEKHLSTDSCLCDGCFRYVDRKANCPNTQRSRKPAARRGPLAGTICAVQECSQAARHSVRRKWLIKLKKSIGKKLVIDMDKNPHLPVPLCSQHYYWVDYFTVCGICKKRLTRNHMYALGPEAEELNLTLAEDRIPVRLSDKLFLCKLCRYYSSLRLRSHRDSSAMTSTSRVFLNSYRKKILQYHDIPVSDSEEEHKSGEEETTKVKKKKSKSKSFEGESQKANDQEKSDPGTEDKSNDSQMIDYSYLDTLNMRRDQQATPTMDYNSLGDFEEQVGFSNIASLLNPLEGQGNVYPQDSANRSRAEKPTRIQVKFGNLNIGKLSNLNIGQDSRSTTNTNPPMERPPYLPGERELKLTGDFEFHGLSNPTSSWERCTSTIQFDKETKKTWQELQRPYGNQSSFLRHLIMLEKYWRSGSLVLSENPDPRAVKYITSIGNRVKAYDGSVANQETKQKAPVLEKVAIPEKALQPEVIVSTPLLIPPRPMSTPVKTTSAPPPLMKISPSSIGSWRPTLLRKIPPPPPYFPPPTSTITSSSSGHNMPQAPPPYRFPSGSSPFASRAIKMTVPSPSFVQSHNKIHQNIRPVSISYQQFKKIRLEKPPVVASQVNPPKRESVVEINTPPVERIRPISSAGSDFTPLICDVRSLATTTSTDDWNETYRQQQQKLLKQNVAKYYAPILPKVPNSLTVTTFPQTSQSQLVMKTSSLTIEKAPSTSTKPSPIPPEKPSISVFREPTPDETV